MARVARSLFDLRPGEAGLVARSALTLFGLICAHTMLETARDALFLGKLPVSRLTFVYALLAGASLVAAKANSRFVTAFGRRNGLIFTLLTATFGTVILYLLEPTRPVVFGLYVWSGLLGSILAVQFWMFVGQIFTVSQGKRLFGLLAAGGVLGAVAGAGLSAALLEAIDVRELLAIAAGLFLATAFFLTGHEVDAVDDAPTPSEKTRAALGGALDLVRAYPYLARLAFLVAVSTAAVLATDYLFKASVAQTHGPEELGPFFARYYTVLNAVALLVQLFVSSALVRRMGVVGAFLVLPALLAIGGGASLVLGGGVAILATKGADGALRHSLHRIASELLWMPLPEHARARAKGLVDTAIVRGTQAGLAGLLLGLAAWELDTPRILAGVVVALSALWIAAALLLRRPYIDLFREALSRRGGSGRLELDLRSVEVVVEALSSREPQDAIAAIDLLEASGRSRLIPALILYHEAREVLLRALEVIPRADRGDWVPLAERLLGHDQEAVRVAALEALARNGHPQVVKGRLLDISPWVRAHAAFWLVQLEPTSRPESDRSIQLVLDMPGPSGLKARLGLLEAIGATGDDRWADLLLELAEHEDPAVARAAFEAMTSIRDPRFIPLLVRRLGVREGRPTVRAALVGLGAPALEQLERALFEPSTPARLRVHLPGAIARFGDRRAAEVLTRGLQQIEDGRVRYKVLRGLSLLISRSSVDVDREVLEARMLADLREHFRMAALHHQLGRPEPEDGAAPVSSRSLLEGLLADKRDQALERAFLLLQVSFPREDLRQVRAAAASSDPRRRAHAQEFLDALTLSARTPELRPLLRLAIDDLPPDERLQRARDDHGLALAADLEAALKDTLQEQDPAVASLAAYFERASGRRFGSEGSSRDAAETASMTDDLRALARRLGAPEEASGLA